MILSTKMVRAGGEVGEDSEGGDEGLEDEMSEGGEAGGSGDEGGAKKKMAAKKRAGTSKQSGSKRKLVRHASVWDLM